MMPLRTVSITIGKVRVVVVVEVAEVEEADVAEVEEEVLAANSTVQIQPMKMVGVKINIMIIGVAIQIVKAVGKAATVLEVGETLIMEMANAEGEVVEVSYL